MVCCSFVNHLHQFVVTRRRADLEAYFALSGFADNAGLYEQMVRSGGSQDVMAAISESFRNLAADLLIEEELHAKAACSRCQAASASLASSVLRAIRRSISSVKAP